MRIGLIQTHAENSRDKNLARLAPLIDDAGRGGVDLLVLPELFGLQFVSGTPDPAYFSAAETLDGPSNTLARTASERHGMVVVSSVFERTALAGVHHNTSVVYDRGATAGIYRKAHLPFSHAFPEKYYFRPGAEPPLTVATSAARIGLIICYERHYPELARCAALAGAEVLCVPVAAASASMREVFEIELRAHAIANGIFVATPNRIGREGEKDYFGGSAIYGPDGAVLARAADNGEDELVTAEVDLDAITRARLDRPFLRDRRPELYSALGR
jgi:N-carbamoylputrescine amidase